MILNRTDSAVQSRLEREAAANPVVAVVSAAIDSVTEAFEIAEDGSGLEIVARAPLANGVANRARMKLFSPKPGHTLIFFYKRSLVPYSRDRYSYGGLDLRSAEVAPEEITGWLEFLSSGFHPDKRPAKLRRAFPYEIPE